MKTKLFAYFVVIVCAVATVGCFVECGCSGTAIALELTAEDGSPVIADSILVSRNGGEPTAHPEEMLDNGSIRIGGAKSGTYHIWVKVGERQWESDDIEVKMGGPEECRRPETVLITVTFQSDSVTSDIETLGSNCG